jgi:protein ImuB
VAAANIAAEAEGVVPGDTLADARVKAGALQVHPVDRTADDAALRALALWATRYTPAVAAWDERSGADGLFLDITGAAHLFGGEQDLLDDLAQRLARFGLPARFAVAATAGAAWALAHVPAKWTPVRRQGHAPNDESHAAAPSIIAAGQERTALAPLPIEALRLSPATRTTLRRLGFKRVGALIDEPRAPFAARFEKELLMRVDQALGRAPEPLAFIAPPPVYHSLRYLLEPIVTQEAVVAVATRLMRDLIHALVRDGVGARRLRLALYRVDSEVQLVDIGLTMPTRSADHVARLIDLKLERVTETIDAGFGFETIGLAVTIAEPMEPQQTDFVAGGDADNAERCAALIDGLQQRLGPHSVRRFKPIASHIPEKAEAECAASAGMPAWPMPDEARPRPVLLLPRAEPAEDVIALVPEGPPQRFRWHGVMHNVARSQGPERIAGEWWRSQTQQPTRDYYLVEDDAGRRFWLYREGLYGREPAAPRWFVHGLFA